MSLLGCISRANRAYTAFVIEHEYMYFLYNDQKNLYICRYIKSLDNMEVLNKKTAGKTLRPERIIQFGEGNFLRAFADWIIYNMDEKTGFNSSVVVVQPIENGMAEALNAQDCLYHVNLQGLEKGRPVNSLTKIDVISRALNPYTQFADYLKLAEQPDMRFVISNTTEAGICFRFSLPF